LIKKIKRFVFGKRLPSWEYKHQRLSKKIALAVFSSDSLSSVAYATEEILLVLIAAGAAALAYSLPISLVIIGLLWILITSYRQTIKAYPKGGGAYIVAKDNLGKYASLFAGGALMWAYILTVAVSVAAGVAALTSAFPTLLPYKVILALVALVLITVLNLKGTKESGIIFAIPTYFFIAIFFFMIIVGFIKYFTGQIVPMPMETIPVISGLTLFMLFRAFSSGSAALTGIEAVSDGVPAFKKPESENARKTLLIMAVILTILFFGITFLSLQYNIVPHHDRTVVSVLAQNIFGNNMFFYIVQTFTMLILFLAANTGFADFPRLSFFLAKDKFLPNQFTQLGERLVFTNGILFLTAASAALIIVFKGSVHNLIPLYAVGVFTTFTLSQTGMVKRSFRLKDKGWKKKALINSIGAVMTFIALIVSAITKFVDGAWVIIILILVWVFVFLKIESHYKKLANQLSVSKLKKPLKLKSEKHMMIVLVPSFHKGIIKSLRFAKSFCKDVKAIHVDLSGAQKEKLLFKWKQFKPDIDLIILDSPYRVITEVVMNYIDEIEKKNPGIDVTLVIPEFVPKKFWHHLLHNQTSLRLKTAIHFRKRTSYISIQYHLTE
jgi:amino acid transporter